MASRDLLGFVICVVEQVEAASAQCARPAGWRQWLEWPLAGVVGRPPPKRRLQCYYDIYWRHDRAKNEVVRASWGPVHHMANRVRTHCSELHQRPCQGEPETSQVELAS